LNYYSRNILIIKRAMPMIIAQAGAQNIKSRGVNGRYPPDMGQTANIQMTHRITPTPMTNPRLGFSFIFSPFLPDTPYPGFHPRNLLRRLPLIPPPKTKKRNQSTIALLSFRLVGSPVRRTALFVSYDSPNRQ
jgi:hypothetical protein